jgi:hypothetical protein
VKEYLKESTAAWDVCWCGRSEGVTVAYMLRFPSLSFYCPQGIDDVSWMLLSQNFFHFQHPVFW